MGYITPHRRIVKLIYRNQQASFGKGSAAMIRWIDLRISSFKAFGCVLIRMMGSTRLWRAMGGN
jgi:hypothetical protein